jgi:hypothetical protein
MAGGISNYAQAKLLDHMIRGNAASWTNTADLKLKLYTAAPDYDAGTGGTEKTGAGGYTTGGNAVAGSSTNWNAPATVTNGRQVTNKQTAAFSWTASADWSSSIVGAALFDNAGTNLLLGKNIDSSRLVYNGDTIRFAAAALKYGIDVTTSAGISTYWKDAALNHLFNLSAYSAPATAYIALFTANPNFMTGVGGTEVTTAGTGYARLAVTMNTAWNATNTSTGICTNSAAFNGWAAATATYGAGTPVIGAALVDTASGAWTNMYCGNSFTGVQIDPGDTFSIASGQFSVKLD